METKYCVEAEVTNEDGCVAIVRSYVVRDPGDSWDDVIQCGEQTIRSIVRNELPVKIICVERIDDGC